MEPQTYALTMQKEMIAEIEPNKAAFVTLIDFRWSWLARPGSNSLILNWFENYAGREPRSLGLISLPTNHRFTIGVRRLLPSLRTRTALCGYSNATTYL